MLGTLIFFYKKNSFIILFYFVGEVFCGVVCPGEDEAVLGILNSRMIFFKFDHFTS